MNFYEFMRACAHTAERVEATRQSVLEPVAKAQDVVDTAQAVAGSAILTGRFVKRGVHLKDELLQQARQGRPPGVLKTAKATFDFLRGPTKEKEQ